MGVIFIFLFVCTCNFFNRDMVKINTDLVFIMGIGMRIFAPALRYVYITKALVIKSRIKLFSDIHSFTIHRCLVFCFFFHFIPTVLLSVIFSNGVFYRQSLICKIIVYILNQNYQIEFNFMDLNDLECRHTSILVSI